MDFGAFDCTLIKFGSVPWCYGDKRDCAQYLLYPRSRCAAFKTCSSFSFLNAELFVFDLTQQLCPCSEQRLDAPNHSHSKNSHGLEAK